MCGHMRSTIDCCPPCPQGHITLISGHAAAAQHRSHTPGHRIRRGPGRHPQVGVPTGEFILILSKQSQRSGAALSKSWKHLATTWRQWAHATPNWAMHRNSDKAQSQRKRGCRVCRAGNAQQAHGDTTMYHVNIRVNTLYRHHYVLSHRPTVPHRRVLPTMAQLTRRATKTSNTCRIILSKLPSNWIPQHQFGHGYLWYHGHVMLYQLFGCGCRGRIQLSTLGTYPATHLAQRLLCSATMCVELRATCHPLASYPNAWNCTVRSSGADIALTLGNHGFDCLGMSHRMPHDDCCHVQCSLPCFVPFLFSTVLLDICSGVAVRSDLNPAVHLHLTPISNAWWASHNLHVRLRSCIAVFARCVWMGIALPLLWPYPTYTLNPHTSARPISHTRCVGQL